MSTVDKTLNGVEGYLISISKNIEFDYYEINAGIPSGWVWGETEEISCKVSNTSEFGSVLLISPKKTRIVVDDLIFHLEKIIETNLLIQKKEDEFKKQIEEMKAMIEEKTDGFYNEMQKLKEEKLKTKKKETSKKLQTNPKQAPKPKSNKEMDDDAENENTIEI